jgi:hypothetical protein
MHVESSSYQQHGVNNTQLLDKNSTVSRLECKI